MISLRKFSLTNSISFSITVSSFYHAFHLDHVRMLSYPSAIQSRKWIPPKWSVAKLQMGRVVSWLLCKWDWNLTHVLVADNSKQSSQVPVFIRILDINDHAPEFAMYYETFVCENAKPGQVNQIIVNFKNFPLHKGIWHYSN